MPLRVIVLSLITSLFSFNSYCSPEFIEPKPLAERIKTTVGNVKKVMPMRVPMITWGGDMVTILANGMDTRTQPDSAMAQAGLDYEFVLQDNFDKQL